MLARQAFPIRTDRRRAPRPVQTGSVHFGNAKTIGRGSNNRIRAARIFARQIFEPEYEAEHRASSERINN